MYALRSDAPSTRSFKMLFYFIVVIFEKSSNCFHGGFLYAKFEHDYFTIIMILIIKTVQFLNV